MKGRKGGRGSWERGRLGKRERQRERERERDVGGSKKENSFYLIHVKVFFSLSSAAADNKNKKKKT